METFYIYGILDNREPNRIRYVGKTTGELRVRMSNHWTYSRRGGRLTRIQGWLKSRQETPEVVEMKVLREVHDEMDLNDAEIEVIAELKAVGQADLNLTEGGEGLRGYTRSKESREALSIRYRESGGPSAKLNWDQVNEIRSHRTRVYEEAVDVASRYGIQRTVVDRILNNTMWRDEGFDPSRVIKRPPGSSKLAKLTMDEVREIRELRQEIWVSARELGERYGIGESAMQHVLENRTYTDPSYNPRLILKRGKR